ncbi:MAG: hypothetical protein VYA54_06670 [Bdellovibrionota bacterium]|nr:hypothetical protein [Bdellovibrionota bacterium]
MKIVILILALLSFNVLACDESILPKIQTFDVKNGTQAKVAQTFFAKSIPCLAQEKHLDINIAVLKLYVRVIEFNNNFEQFEILFPYFKKHKPYFEKTVMKNFSTRERKLIIDHYTQYLVFDEQGGNG